MKALVIVGCAIALVASGVSAQLIADFEGAVNPFSAGTIVADPENAANSCLFLAAGELATYNLSPILAGGKGISMKVYDHARSCLDDLTDPLNPIPADDSRPAGTKYGWIVGVTGTYNYGVSLVNKPYIGINSGYAYPGNWYTAWPQTGSVFSPGWFGGPRQIGPGGLSIIGTGTIAAPEILGDGAWSTWIVGLLADGTILVENVEMGTTQIIAGDPVADPPVPSPGETSLTQVYLYGGRVVATADGLGDVWVDDVQIVDVAGPGPGLLADFDNDGDVDLDDFVILKTNFGTGTTHAQGDADGDADVDLDDFVILKNEFGS